MELSIKEAMQIIQHEIHLLAYEYGSNELYTLSLAYEQLEEKLINDGYNIINT